MPTWRLTTFLTSYMPTQCNVHYNMITNVNVLYKCNGFYVRAVDVYIYWFTYGSLAINYGPMIGVDWNTKKESQKKELSVN